MNILPKKRWHVRTKENIARVRRDEAKAAEEAKETQRKIELAEKETKRDFLRKQARLRFNDEETAGSTVSSSLGEHLNFFKDIEEGLELEKKTNKEYEREKKEEKEKYEKQIGYLTYLGQDTDEATGRVSWWAKERELRDTDGPELFTEKKVRYDPLFKISAAVGLHRERPSSSKETVREKEEENKKRKLKEKHDKSKKKKKHSSSPETEKYTPSVEELRMKRLKREREEKLRAEMLLAKVHGETVLVQEPSNREPVLKQRYNSQFNPHLAKQNSFV